MNWVFHKSWGHQNSWFYLPHLQPGSSLLVSYYQWWERSLCNWFQIKIKITQWKVILKSKSKSQPKHWFQIKITFLSGKSKSKSRSQFLQNSHCFPRFVYKFHFASVSERGWGEYTPKLIESIDRVDRWGRKSSRVECAFASRSSRSSRIDRCHRLPHRTMELSNDTIIPKCTVLSQVGSGCRKT